ncbi:peroxisome biogenesis factor 13 isoform X2 [Neopelma chrysocephalum]|uniref:peroxisome biogenesis factor 13 isoform X2 n=1 Tax=Neopelma chrysocephalum TaxID=114329 RepID=UPI000FCD2F4B|nr:peroxisome biogenesis factor 13 isoform X2 [Neopelma chrysocephalum]
MAATPPPKPWESRRLAGTAPAFQSADLGDNMLTRPGQPAVARIPPPILPRPSQQTGSSSLSTFRPAYSGSFSPGYGSYGTSFYGSYSPYSYGYGGLGYNRFCAESLPPSRFVQQAEESSRGAFQSIESIVHAFASVSMMMDATFSAVYNSFRAVLDVANHFSRLKIHFTKVFSAFALVRTIRYLYQRLQRLLGLRSSSENEDLWAESEGKVARVGLEDKMGNSAKSWPIFLFFAVIMGGPYLIWKLLSTYSDEETVSSNWASGEDDHVVGRAEYDFNALSEEEISFRAGDMLKLAPKEQQPKIRGWLLASYDGQTTGLVPANYIKILGKRRGRRTVDLEKIPEQRPAFPSTPGGGATAAVTLEEQEAAFETVFAGSSKDPVASDSTVGSGEKQEL